MHASPVAGALLALALAAPARAEIVAWRAFGSVDYTLGVTSLLPLPAAAGDDFVIVFSYDDAAADTSASPDVGTYPLLSMVVSIAGESLDYVAAGSGSVNIQANASPSNLWGVTAHLGSPSGPELDQARLNFFFPANTILSDALTDPPDPAGASVQFGLFSRDLPAPEEAFVVASLESVVPVPEPGGACVAACAALAALRLAARRRP